MQCAYCGKESVGTREHIISSGILDLFPECFLTYDNKRERIYPSDPMIKDVCAECNNKRLTYIDSYAKAFIGKYFLASYEPDTQLKVEYNYVNLQKVFLKYAYNDLRSRGEDTTFFNEEIKDFLLDETAIIPLANVSIMAGLAINTSPAPDCIFGNLKIRWCKSPVLLANSIVENYDWLTGHIRLRDKPTIQHFDNLLLSYVFRFNSGQFILLCWDKPLTEQEKVVLSVQYPYTLLSSNTSEATLSRCTSEATYHLHYLIDVSWGQGIFDDISIGRNLSNPEHKLFFDRINKLWAVEEKKIAEEHKRK